MQKKMQVNFNDDALLVLDKLRASTPQGTYASVIRDALSFYAWAHEESKEGNSIGAFKNGKVLTEVVLPFEFRESWHSSLMDRVISPPDSETSRTPNM